MREDGHGCRLPMPVRIYNMTCTGLEKISVFSNVTMNAFMIIVLVGLVAIVVGYDFQDEVYNQIIKQDLDELESSIFNKDDELINVRRRKRDETAATAASSASAAVNKSCKKRRWSLCCGEEALDRVIDKDRELKKECFKEVMAKVKDDKDDKTMGIYDPFSCEKIQKIKKEYACVVQCVGQKKNIIDAEGNFKEKELLEFYKKELTQDVWLYNLIEKALPNCIEYSKNATIAFELDKSDPLSCNPIPIKMHHCMWRELQLSCPDEKITDAKTCAKIREKIKKHEYLPFRHHHHHHHEDE